MKSRRILACLLATTLVLTGCSSEKENKQVENKTNELEQSSEKKQNSEKEANIELNTESSGLQYVINLKETFSVNAGNTNYEMNTPMYELEDDYVFKLKGVDINTYKVVDSLDNLTTSTSDSKSVNDINDGYVYVKPGNVVHFDNLSGYDNTTKPEELQSHYTKVNADGTWGSYTKLYLIQLKDVDGNTLEKPIVTPFTIKHKLEAPVTRQSIGEDNNYRIDWDVIPGANMYYVFKQEYNDITCEWDSIYKLEAVTNNNYITSADMADQTRSNFLENLIEQELKTNGESTFGLQGGNVIINNVLSTSNKERFLVVAIDTNGNVSGTSNILDTKDIEKLAPVKVKDNGVVKADITNITDVPAYVDIEMADGSLSKYVIDYHGGQMLKFPDNPTKVAIQAKVYNTDFSNITVVLNGLTYDEVLSNIKTVTEREDAILANVKTTKEEQPEIRVPAAPETTTDKETADIIEEQYPEIEKTEINQEEIEQVKEPVETETVETETVETETVGNDEQKPETTESTSSDLKLQLLSEVASSVKNNMTQLGDITSIMYANSELEAWIANCLVTRQEVIPIPCSVFSEAADVERAALLLLEAYRQNPTSGMISDLRYSYEYEAFGIKYADDSNDRLNKTVQELAKAKEVVNSVIKPEMTDYDKVVALNNYFCANASYDFDSTSTEVQDTYSQAFIDAHTPYGILCNNYGVCESYSEAMILTGRYAGLNVLAEVGTLYGGGHEWNRVMVDGQWCILDVTNNDMDRIPNGLLNVTDNQVSGILLNDNSAYIGSKLANDITKEYYYNNGLVAEGLESNVEIMLEQLKSSNKAFVRLPAGTSELEAVDILQQVVLNTQVKPKDAEFMFGVLMIEN